MFLLITRPHSMVLLYTKAMKIIGHRGARGLAPENTIASIEKAIRHGVDEVEIDVRMTKDHVAVLHHDSHVTDPSGTEVSIKHTKYVDLLRHKPDLAPLDHVIRTIAHRCPVIIEIKPGENPTKTIELIRYYLAKGWRLDEFSITSFDFSILRKVKRELPHVQLIVLEKWSSIRARSRANKLGTKHISMSQRWLWLGFVKAVYRGSWQLYTFPSSKSGHEVPKSWRPYLYATITDRPDKFEN